MTTSGAHQHTWGVVALFAGTLVACSSSPTETIEREINLIENSGFEVPSSDPGLPAPALWERAGGGRPGVSFVWEDAVSHEGSRSVALTVQSNEGGRFSPNWLQRIQSGFQIDSTYRIGGWVKTQDVVTGVFVVLQCVDPSGTELLCFATTQDADVLAGTNDWTRLEVEFTVAAGTDHLSVLIGMTSENVGGTVWFDDLWIAPQ